MMRAYLPILKTEPQEDGSLIVVGRATDETVDSQGERVLYEASKKAFGAWKSRNIREMHDPRKAVGKAVDVITDDEDRAVDLRIKVSSGAPDTIAKVRDGVLQGLSIGGEVPEDARKSKGDAIELTEYVLDEVSLVDAPANPSATISLVKVSDGELAFSEVTPADLAAAPIEDLTESDPVEKAEDEDEEEAEKSMDERMNALDETVVSLVAAFEEKGCGDREEKAKEEEEGKPEETEKAEEKEPEPEAEEKSATEKVLTEADLDAMREIVAQHIDTAIRDIAEALGVESGGDEEGAVEEAKQEPPKDEEEETSEEKSGLARALGAIEERLGRLEGSPVLGKAKRHAPDESEVEGLDGDLAKTFSDAIADLPETVDRNVLAAKLAHSMIKTSHQRRK